MNICKNDAQIEHIGTLLAAGHGVDLFVVIIHIFTTCMCHRFVMEPEISLSAPTPFGL